MLGEISVWWSWLILLVMILLFVGLVAAGWWLLRRRRRHETRAEAAEELRASLSGLGMVWQAPLFQADIVGVHGGVDDFEMRAELWDKTGHDFLRLAIYFPRSVQQDLSVRRRRKGLRSLWRREEITVDDKSFDEVLRIDSRPNQAEAAREILSSGLRRRLQRLGRRVDDLRIGDRSLYWLIHKEVNPADVAPLITDSLELARIFYERALDQEPQGGARNTEYEMVAGDALRRSTSTAVAEAGLPSGTAGEESIDEGDKGDEESSDEGQSPPATDAMEVYRRLGSSSAASDASGDASTDSEVSPDSEATDDKPSGSTSEASRGESREDGA